MSAPRRHSDYDVLDPEDVHPRGEASYDQLRRAYNLTEPQAHALAATVKTSWALQFCAVRTQTSMQKRCADLFETLGGKLYPSPLGRKVAHALANSRRLAQARGYCERHGHDYDDDDGCTVCAEPRVPMLTERSGSAPS